MTLEAERMAVLAAAEAVRGCADEAALSATLDAAARALGLDHWVFVAHAPQEGEMGSYYFLAGCPPEWCQRYLASCWFANDPMLAYAFTHTEPCLAGDVALVTTGQNALMQAAAQAGFVDGLIVPAHGVTHRRVGVLYLAAGRTLGLDGAWLAALRALLRSLANELLDWADARLRSQTLERWALTERDLRLLRAQREGMRTREIAALEGASEHTINRAFGAIIQRLGVDSRSAAAALADNHGLLR